MNYSLSPYVYNIIVSLYNSCIVGSSPNCSVWTTGSEMFRFHYVLFALRARRVRKCWNDNIEIETIKQLIHSLMRFFFPIVYYNHNKIVLIITFAVLVFPQIQIVYSCIYLYLFIYIRSGNIVLFWLYIYT